MRPLAPFYGGTFLRETGVDDEVAAPEPVGIPDLLHEGSDFLTSHFMQIHLHFGNIYETGLLKKHTFRGADTACHSANLP